MRDPTARFTDRVDNYVKYRPHYPHTVIETLREKLGFSPDWSVADIFARHARDGEIEFAYTTILYVGRIAD
jgi:hypothetical protein